MSRIMVRYKVKPDLAETNADLVRAVYEELHRVRPSHIRYVTFQLDDGVTFVHLYANDSGDGQNALGELPSYRSVSRPAQGSRGARTATRRVRWLWPFASAAT